jgi:SAM-dependent methyltransferase
MPDVLNRTLGHPTSASAPHRIAKVDKLEPFAGRWLDVGCGAGAYTELLLDHHCSTAVGADVRLRRPLPDLGGLSFVDSPSEHLPFASGSFDGVLMNEVLEHVEDERAALAEIHRVLAPGGLLVMFCPNRWFPFEGHGATIRGHFFEFPVPVIPWLPSRLTYRWTHARNYWPRQLKKLVREAGFEVNRVGFAYPLFVEYTWLPAALAERMKSWAPQLEATPVVRRFGISTMLLARSTPYPGPPVST